MAYSATKNGEVFFSTDSMDQSLALASAQLELKAGAAGLFSFTVLPNNRFYDEFSLVSDYIDVYRNQKLIFSGRVSSISQAFDLSLKIEAQGLLSILNDTVFRPETHEGTVRQLLTKLINSHNDQVEAAKQITIGTVQIADDPCYRAYDNYESTFSRLSDLVDSFGGYLYIRKESGGLYLDWKEITTQGAQSVNFGENLIDISRGSDTENYITVLIPLGAQIENTTTGERTRVTIASVNQGRDYIVKSGATNRIVGTYIWDDVTEPENLLRKGQAWLDKQAMLYTTIDVTTIDLADAGYDIDNFEIGKVIAVTSYPHGLENDTFECLSQSLNLLSPDDNKLSLGGVVEGFTIRARKEAKLNTRVIEKIEANYTTNQRLNELKTLLDQSIQENYTLIEQNSESIVLLAEQIKDASKVFYEEPVPPYSKGDLWYRGLTDDETSAVPGIAIPGLAIPGVGGDLYICNVDREEDEAFNISDWSPTFRGQLEGINKRITSAKIEIDSAKGQIDLLGQDINYLRGTVSQAEVKVNAVDARVDLAASRIDNLTGDLRSAELEIDGANANISLVATDVDRLEGRVSTAELKIDAANSEIALKVSSSDYNAATIVAKINAAGSSVTISADHIKLEGIVTANQKFKILTDGSMQATGATISGDLVIYKNNEYFKFGTFTRPCLASNGTVSYITDNGLMYGADDSAAIHNTFYALEYELSSSTNEYVSSYQRTYRRGSGSNTFGDPAFTYTGNEENRVAVELEASNSSKTYFMETAYTDRIHWTVSRGGLTGVSALMELGILYSRSTPYFRIWNGNRTISSSSYERNIIENGYLVLYNENIYVNGNLVAVQSSSSKRYKHDITTDFDEQNDPHRLYDLPPKQFVYNEDHSLQYADMKDEALPGFIAEDVAKIYPMAVIHNPDGEVESWDERRILPGMLALLQEQKRTIDDLTVKMRELEETVKRRMNSKWT